MEERGGSGRPIPRRWSCVTYPSKRGGKEGKLEEKLGSYRGVPSCLGISIESEGPNCVDRES